VSTCAGTASIADTTLSQYHIEHSKLASLYAKI
jgi:hypothetical protein